MITLKIEDYDENNNYICIVPNNYIEKILSVKKDNYIIDFIYFINGFGLKLYSESIFMSF